MTLSTSVPEQSSVLSKCALFIWSSAVAYDNSEQEWSQGMREKKIRFAKT